MSFPCTRCGLCCQNIDKVEILKEYHRGNGVCIYYKPNFGCTIYENRPLVCRIDEGYVVFASDQLSLEDYYYANAEVCNQLQEAANLSVEWRVKL
jgi:Fe-S-cluster containining protein